MNLKEEKLVLVLEMKVNHEFLSDIKLFDLLLGLI